MASDLETGSEASATQLVSGIIADAQMLIKEQLALLRHELKEDFRNTKEASFYLVGGLAVAMVGVVLLCLMLVYLLSWAAPAPPLWVCYGVVGTPIAALGSALCFRAIHKFKVLTFWPSESAQALRENVEWITKPE